MILHPDVNVLVYAHRAQDPDHEVYRSWLDDALSTRYRVAFSSLTIAGFVRVTTSARVYREPTPLDVALSTVDAWLSSPRSQVVHPGRKHWEVLRALLGETSTSGGGVSDAQHAAVAIEHGLKLVSRDGGFERFVRHGLEWERLVPPAST